MDLLKFFSQVANGWWGNNPLVSNVIAGIIILIIGGVLGRLIPWIGTRFVHSIRSVWAKIRGQGDDYTFEKAYLDWLIGHNSHLGIIPAQMVTRRWGERQQLVDLEKVYVRLSVSAKSGDEQWAEEYGMGEKSWRRQPSLEIRFIRYVLRDLLKISDKKIPFLKEQAYQSGDLGLIVDRHKRLVIRGHPGSGKSTLMRYLAVTCARTLRKNKKEGDSSRLVKDRLLWDKHPFPMLVTLKRHGNVINWNDERVLIDIFPEEMPFEMRKKCPPDFFERRLRKGNCLILLDAFDELGSIEARSAMAHKIADFLAVYNHPNNRMVVTTRIVGYEGQLDRHGFVVRTVQDLNAGEIRALVKLRYKAIIQSETLGRPPQDARAIQQKLLQRSKRLIEKIESNMRLSQLATNPMLLSLIVLVHFLKVELPEDRQFLYRDCVEILTEQWQKSKAEEAGIWQEEREELTLSQKIVLLREIAFAMQQQREEEGQPTLISRNAARDIIAERLPDFLNTEVPLSEGKRKEFFLRKAEEWIDGIQVDSGILVEQGFDQEGEPLIGFSHLTFQEYLAAVAANDIDEHRSILRHNLLKPAWREVVLLYVALVNDATSTIHALLDAPTQPYGVLLAGACLTERLKKVHPDAQHMVLAKLKQGFSQADDTQVGEFGKVMGQLGQSETTAFLRTQLHHPSLAKRLAVIKALGQTRTNDPEIESVKNDLLQLLDTVSEPEITVATRESLASVGDPRFSNIEPMLVRVHRPYPIVAASPKTWKELLASPEWQKDKKFTRRFELAYCFVTRPMDIWLFLTWNALWRRPQCADFEIGKYPITNLEYNRFIEATGHKAPKQWLEGTFPQEEATHPVRGISSTDAEAYCKWLSNQTGKKYRLPTEWEWEWAAAGPQGWKYPWGNQFDKNKCNTKEAGIENTTPVGSYPAGMSPYGASDMCGNVYEITKGYFLFGDTSNSLFIICSILFFVISIFTILIPIFFITLIILNIIFSSYMFFSLLKSVEYSVLRGGVYSAPYDQSTCFYQKYHFRGTISTRGFRCVREL